MIDADLIAEEGSTGHKPLGKDFARPICARPGIGDDKVAERIDAHRIAAAAELLRAADDLIHAKISALGRGSQQPAIFQHLHHESPAARSRFLTPTVNQIVAAFDSAAMATKE